jgi:hypothetical protein
LHRSAGSPSRIALQEHHAGCMRELAIAALRRALRLARAVRRFDPGIARRV